MLFVKIKISLELLLFETVKSLTWVGLTSGIFKLIILLVKAVTVETQQSCSQIDAIGHNLLLIHMMNW